MIRNILEHIHGISAYPVIALVIFVSVFVGFALWALTMSRAQVHHASRLPLESDTPSSEGDPRHDA